MTSSLLIALAWKSALICAAALLMVEVLRRRPAAEKSLAASLALGALLLLPLLAVAVPAINLPPSPVIGSFVAVSQATAQTVASASTDPRPGAVSQPDWPVVVIDLYLAGAGLLLIGVFHSLYRLRSIRRRAALLTDPHWLSSLARAQERMDCKQGTALLTTPELRSPISWGVLRPTIVIDDDAKGQYDNAEAIIAHELAHVVRLDWLALMAGRLVLAIYWFNPLAWFLVRRAHQLSEESADNAVLRAKIPGPDYASMLVEAMRHSSGSPLLANAVAPNRSALARRVHQILDPAIKRDRARPAVSLVTMMAAALATTALASLQPVAARPPQIMDPTAGERASAILAGLSSDQSHALGNAIRHSDWDERKAGPSTLFTDRAAVAPLVLALADDRPEVRRIAVWGLSELRPPPSALADRIAILLDDPSPSVREQAVGALGDFGDVSHLQGIEARLGDPDASVRTRAAHALGDLQMPGSRSALERALGDPDGRVRAKASWALAQVHEAERILARP